MQEEYNYGDFLVFYKEAEYTAIHLKKEDLMEIIIEELSNYSDKKQQFISEYIADIDVLSIAEVDVVCKFAESNEKLLVESIVRCLDKDNSAISTNCNHILESADLVSCLKNDPTLLDRLQQSIDSVENITKRDMTTNMKMLGSKFMLLHQSVSRS